MNSNCKKSKAFTLTELLVVVIVIGVLSAIILPKFSKVVETRKTTEAEELMSAVRTEQEKRCTLDKDYLVRLSEVKDILPTEETKNFTYTLTSTGITAQSKGKYNYTLKMPSYKDGRICCENEEECKKLNKDYPLCSSLIAQADYQSGEECSGSACDLSKKPADFTTSCGCGRMKLSYFCHQESGGWRPQPTGSCILPEGACQTGATQQQSCVKNGSTGTQTRKCSSCSWGEWSECKIQCDISKKPADSTTSCGCGRMKLSYFCHQESGGWRPQPVGSCILPEGACQTGATQQQSCVKNGRTGTQTRKCSSCRWGEWSECDVPPCPYGERSDGTCKEALIIYEPVFTGAQKIPACPVASNPVVTSKDCTNLRCPNGGTFSYTTGSWDSTCNYRNGPPHAFTAHVQAVKAKHNGSDWWFCVFNNFECKKGNTTVFL